MQYKIQLTILSAAILLLAGCNGGSSSSNPPAPNPAAQQFATQINNQLTTIGNNNLTAYQVAFPSSQSAATQAYIIAATAKSIQPNPNFPSWVTTYVNPILYSYTNTAWESAVIPFASESTLVSATALTDQGLYLATESYTIYSTSSGFEYGLNFAQLYNYNNGLLNVVANPFVSACTNDCNITSLLAANNVIYAAGWNDSGTQIYSYDGKTWTSLLTQPSSQLTIISLASDTQGKLYASGYYGTPSNPGASYLAVYSNGTWNNLPYANGGMINYNGSNLFSVPFTFTTAPNIYNLYQLNNSQWKVLNSFSVGMYDCGMNSVGSSLVNDQYGNIYVNVDTYCVKGGDQRSTNLIFTN